MYNKLLLLTDLLSNNKFVKQTSLCFKGSWSWKVFCNRLDYFCDETKFELSKHQHTKGQWKGQQNSLFTYLNLQASPKSIVHSQSKLHYKVQYIKQYKINKQT